MRKLDKLKPQARAALGIKNIRSWMGYDDTVDLETNWKNAIAEYRRRERSAQMIQGAWRTNSVLTPREVVTHTSRLGDVFLNYHFDLTETEEEGMLREVRRAMRSVPKSEGKAYYGIVAFGGGAWRVLSTPHYTTKQQAYDEFVQRLAAHLQKYDTNAVVQEISINVIEPNPRNGSGGRSYVQACKKWKIFSPQAERNCAYKAVALCLHKKDQNVLIEQPKRLTKLANDLKYRVNPEHKAYANDMDLQRIADYKKVPIVLYNNVYERLRVFTPVGEENKRKDRLLDNHPVEIMLEANHFSAMLLRRDIGEPYVPESPKPPEDGPNKLITKPDILKPYDGKFVAWDLECSGNRGYAPDIIRDQPHKCYASGFAWGGDEYRSFWGMDAIRQSLDFIYDNRQTFDGYTFYAHNGGAYDMTFMFREGLLEDARFKVVNCVEQNSAYIHVKVFVGDCAIVFHDSLRLLPAGLEKLCKEFKVEHQKLTETVDHDDITADNWHAFTELPRYLENDCKGLYEVLEAFSKQTFEATAQDEFRGCEAYTRQIFEHAFGVEFKKTRPKWLEGLELDGYNPDIKTAFEYDGEHHVVYPNWFHKTEAEFKQLQENDRKKDALCRANGVKLYRIPHQVKFKALPDFIGKLLGVDVMVEPNPGVKVGINMTACYTGASLSKKSFFAKYYKPQKYPIYSLNRSTDKFIRDFYYGGRVEIFHLGKVLRDKLYYYDFTSLYPWAGTLPLPYGEPVWVEKFDHFGFASVLVKSREDMIHRKPLHGLKEDGKLLFRHFKDWTPMILFSEELKLGIKSGMYEYDVRGGYAFQSAPWMAKFFEDAFKRKAGAKRDGNPALAQVWKIIANSGYGFWGLRTADRDSILIQEADKSAIYPYLESGKFLNYNEIGDYSIMRVEKDLPVTDFNVGVASAISSYSRCRLWSLINDIESKGKQIFMCDTDSVITDCDLSEYPDLMSAYMWDGCGDDLGSLKNEADDFLKDNGLTVRSQGMEHFDELILGGCKFYALRKDGCAKEITKCKGYKKGDLTFEDFEFMAGGGVKSQRQVQFLCPKMNHVSMDEKFALRTPHIVKKFKFAYTKGHVADDGNITPFFY